MPELETCSSCGADCCECEAEPEEPEDQFWSGRFQFHQSSIFDRNPCRRMIGIELECSGRDESYTSSLYNAARHWGDSSIYDGSLPRSGFELVLNPTNGDLFLEHVKNITDGMHDVGASVSRDCGFHVHVDGRDYTWYDLWKLCRIYQLVEPALLSLTPRHRHQNRFCKRFADISLHWNGFKYRLLRALYEHDFATKKHPNRSAPGNGTGPRHLPRIKTCGRNGKKVFHERTQKYHHARYCALNLHSFFHRGTIEFRLAAASTNCARIQNWSLVCGWLVEQATKLTTIQIDALSNDPWNALLSLIPALSVREWAERRRDSLQRAA